MCCCFAKAETEEAAAAERERDEDGGMGAVKENADAVYSYADVEKMFAVVVEVIAGVCLRESPKAQTWIIRRRPIADELHASRSQAVQSGGGSRKSESDAERENAAQGDSQTAQKARVVSAAGQIK